jgi:hypothetical protein
VRLTTLALLIIICSALLCAQTAPPAAPAQQNPQAPPSQQPLSPRGQAEFTFADGKKIAVDYGRPSARGRKIMGGLVPYGSVWRTGANEATGFVTQADIVLGDARIAAGKYTMYTLPGENSWTIIINRQTGQWGTKYDQSQDLARVTARPSHLPQPVEQFTISFESRGPNAGIMKLDWENTSVPVEFSEANR